MPSKFSCFGCGAVGGQVVERDYQDAPRERWLNRPRSSLPRQGSLWDDLPRADGSRPSGRHRAGQERSVSMPPRALVPFYVSSPEHSTAGEAWQGRSETLAVPQALTSPAEAAHRTPSPAIGRTQANDAEERLAKEDFDARLAALRSAAGLPPFFPPAQEHALTSAAEPAGRTPSPAVGGPEVQDVQEQLAKEDFDARLAALRSASGVPRFFPPTPEHASANAAETARRKPGVAARKRLDASFTEAQRVSELPPLYRLLVLESHRR